MSNRRRLIVGQMMLIGLIAVLVMLTAWQGQAAQAATSTNRMRSATAQLVYVNKNATGANDGTSWADAYATLQAALDVANANGGTTYEIWVAEGVYYPDEGGSHMNNAITETFRLNYNNVQLYGGFVATETLRSQRNWVASPTILSGDIDQDGTLANNAYHVLYLEGGPNQPLTAATVVDGFTITGGNANGNYRDGSGGGLFCVGIGNGYGCSPTLTNLTFSNNSAILGGGMYNDGLGGGVSSPMLTNVTFSGNAAGYGGGMVNDGEYSGTASPTLVNVTFSSNLAVRGGAIYNSGYSSGVSNPTLTNVTFTGNAASDFGGGMVNDGSQGMCSPTLTNVTFSGNSASQYGGGMYNDGTDGVSSPVVVNSILWDNIAITGTQIYTTGNASPIITYSDVQGGYVGAGNLNIDPRFIAPITATVAPTTTGNYRLQLTSPVIDAGNNLSVTVATGLDGRSRKVDMPTPDTGLGTPPIVDMGAYEAHPLMSYLPLIVKSYGSALALRVIKPSFYLPTFNRQKVEVTITAPGR